AKRNPRRPGAAGGRDTGRAGGAPEGAPDPAREAAPAGASRTAGRAPSAPPGPPGPPASLLSSDDIHLFNEGTHYRLYERLGAHAARAGAERATHFAV